MVLQKGFRIRYLEYEICGVSGRKEEVKRGAQVGGEGREKCYHSDLRIILSCNAKSKLGQLWKGDGFISNSLGAMGHTPPYKVIQEPKTGEISLPIPEPK